MQVMRILFVCAVISFAWGSSFGRGDPSDHQRRRLVNEEYKLSVEVPAGATTCEVTSPGGGHRHGFSILLSLGRCQTPGPVRYVMLVGDYNATFDATPERYLRMLCPHGRPLALASEPHGLSFPSRPSAVCKCDESKGWVDVFVVAGGGQTPKGFGVPPSVPYIYYKAILHTRVSRLASDLEAFRRILATVRIGDQQVP